MSFVTPFMLGPFAVDPEGRIAPRDPDAMPAFFFRWRGRVIRARLRQAGAEQGHLLLRSVLGRVPSTAAMPDIRGQSFAALRWLPRAVPPTWSLHLLPDHRVLLDVGGDIALPITASGLLRELTGFVLELSPYLDLLEELGMAPSGGGAEPGMANT